MTLPSGSRLGPYEILAPLGAGGMGEVYRARDLRLDRELAIKVLPESVGRDADFLARFQSEARAASALNHPNIVTIHDIGSADGYSYILMELVDGKTLRLLLEGGPPALKKTLQIAAQAADGLAAAHERGIVHRDLKPENLMVSKDGVVKILDFGLAKTTPLYARAEDETGSYEAVLTEPGRVIGTVGYMSPEQATGRSVDFRSDQFAFGTILYEMLTGRRAWKRNSAAETLTAIIREDPDPIAAAAPATPAALRWVVDRCLSKDPEERYASTRDLARDLTTIRNRLSEVSGVELPSGTRGRRSPARSALLLGAVAAAALGAGIFLAPRLGKHELPAWTQIGSRRGTVWSGRFTPDGRTIVYSAAWNADPVRLFSTRPGSTDTRTLDLPPGKIVGISSRNDLAFLRKPRFVTLFYNPGTLVRAGLEGGVARDLLDGVLSADWSPDGRELAVAREVDGKIRLEYPIGKKIYEGDLRIGDIRVSRDGAWIAFFEQGVNLIAVRVSDGERRVLSKGWFAGTGGLAWSADGREIWFTPMRQVRDSIPPLLAVSLSGRQREIVRGPGQLRLFDIAPDGRVLLARWDVQVGVRGFSPPGRGERELSATDDSMLSDVSSDGRAVLFYDRKALFLRTTEGSPPLRLGEGYAEARLSPDGKSVLALPTEGKKYPMLVPVGAGDVRQVETALECDGAEWFPDGRRILCKNAGPDGFRLTAIDVASGRAAEVKIAPEAADFHEGGYVGSTALLSPDGAFLAGLGGGGDILLLPLGGGAPRRIANAFTGSDVEVRPAGWTADGKSIFLHRIGDVPDKVLKLDVATGRVEPWRDLAPEDPAGVFKIHPVRVAPDGRAWAYTYLRLLSDLYVVEGLK